MVKSPQIMSPVSVNSANVTNNIKVVNAQQNKETNRTNNLNLNFLQGNNLNLNLDPSIDEQIASQDNFRKQKHLKCVLKEFGLQQYLRVII
jgi:hypothetical protein